MHDRRRRRYGRGQLSSNALRVALMSALQISLRRCAQHARDGAHGNDDACDETDDADARRQKQERGD